MRALVVGLVLLVGCAAPAEAPATGLRGWVAEHPEVVDQLSRLAADGDAVNSMVTAGDVLGVLRACADGLVTVRSIQASDATFDPRAPVEWREALADWSESFRRCTLQDWDGAGQYAFRASAHIDAFTSLLAAASPTKG